MENDNIKIAKTQTTNKESSNGSKKATSSSSTQRLQDQQQEALKCPRCDSMNTKFCYYNNYCLSQPRHFCKSCRRYWTKGGSIRNVPIGGGCRKSKKLKASPLDSSRDSSTSFDIGRLKFFHGFSSSSSPTIDFQLGGLSIPRLNLSSSPSSGVICNQVSNNSSFGDIEGSSLATHNTCFNLDPTLGLSFSLPPLFKQQSENNVLHDGVGNQDGVFIGDQVATSIESLSSINQELHWKLQQQRFASMLFGGEDNVHQNENNVSQGLHTFPIHHQEIQRPHPISFQNLDLSPRASGGSFGNYSRKEGQISNLAIGYFLDDTSAPTRNSTTTTNGANNGNANVSWNNGAQAWNNLDLFNALP